jgi:phosphohistidine phosphatase
MDLFLIRHAKAADGSLYGEDSERPLTADGRAAATQVGAALHKHGVGFDAILVSPFVRAVETAELVAVGISYTGALEVSRLLEPGGDPPEIISRLIAHRKEARVALVGHEPSMGRLLSALLGKHGLSLSKGAAVRLQWDGKHAHLTWIVKPKKLDPVASLDGL